MTSPLIDQGLTALRDGDPAAARRAFAAAVAERETGGALEGLAEALYLECEYSAAALQYERAYAAYRRSRRRDGSGARGALGGVDHGQRPRRLGGAERLAGSGPHDPGGGGERPARTGLGADHPIDLGSRPEGAGGDAPRGDGRRPSLRRSRHRVRGARISRRPVRHDRSGRRGPGLPRRDDGGGLRRRDDRGDRGRPALLRVLLGVRVGQRRAPCRPVDACRRRSHEPEEVRRRVLPGPLRRDPDRGRPLGGGGDRAARSQQPFRAGRVDEARGRAHPPR